MMGYLLLTILLLFNANGILNANTCTKDDLVYTYTECSDNTRWRVQVPAKSSQCTANGVAFPTVGLSCNFTCPAGNYLDIEQSACRHCPAGYYSLGSGVRYDTFRTVPAELKVSTEKLGDAPNSTCNDAGWIPMGSFLAGKPDSRCVLKLLLTVNLATEGLVTFQYQYRRSEALFMFDVQNDRCESLGATGPGPWLEETEQGETGTRTTQLRMGMNVLRWTLVAPAGQLESHDIYPALLHSIEVTGLPFVYSCQPCRPGLHSAAGQSRCAPCPRDNYSPGEAAPCRPCPADQFAPPGSAECRRRPPCRLYEPWQEACSSPGNSTRLRYRWVQPQVCREVTGGATLPAPGPPEACSAEPCNPGTELVVGAASGSSTSTSSLHCRACPTGSYSATAAGAACAACPANTQPRHELLIANWLLPLSPPELVTASCHAADAELGCPGPDNGWLRSRRCLRTAAARAFSSRVLQLSLSGGFLPATSDLFGRQGPPHVAELRLEFELNCRMPCQLALYELSELRGATQRRRWSDSQARQNYTYKIASASPVTFQLVFETVVSVDLAARENATGDHLKVFAVQATNVNGSGAVACTRCPMGLKDAKCIPCMPGHYYLAAAEGSNSSSSSSSSSSGGGGTCLPCPPGTRVIRHPAEGLDSCAPCPPGLRPDPTGVSCRLEARPVAPDNRTLDLRPLLNASGAGSLLLTVESGKMFTFTGSQYSHLYNLSMAGTAVCQSNATKLVSRVSQSILCRTTQVPRGRGGGASGSTGPSLMLPVSLADSVLNASHVPRRDTDARLLADGFVAPAEAAAAAAAADVGIGVHARDDGPAYDLELWLGLSGDAGATKACPSGRLTRLTLRCDPSSSSDGAPPGRLLLPPRCPDATCDGCEFRLLLLSRHACPLCRQADFDRVLGECAFGRQTVHLFPPKYCFEPGGVEPGRHTEIDSCAIVSGPILVMLCALLVLGALCCGLACYCYRKNKSLQYKYTQLVEATDGHSSDGGVESCAVYDGEIDQEDDGEEKVSAGAGRSAGASGSRGGAFFAKRKAKATDKAALMESLGDVDL